MASHVRLVEGDITRMDVDAIVNAANSELVGGGGVCGAIFSGAGWDVMAAACRSIGGCEVGGATATPGFDLPASWVIHAVGPIWRGGHGGEEHLLRSAYRSALAEADRIGVRTIAFPLLSSGIYGYPVNDACRVAVETLRQTTTSVEDIAIVAFEPERAAIVRRLLEPSTS